MSNSYDKVAKTSDRISEALKLRNMKQIELSEKSGINKPSISCYISGKYEPKQSALYKMGKALDVSEMWLAGYDIPMERPLEQKQNDDLVDLIERIQKEKDFRTLMLSINRLTHNQIEVLKSMISAFNVD